MNLPHQREKILAGSALAILATLIWAGNFIIARGVIREIPPVSLAFFRWMTASIILFPLGIGSLVRDWPVIRRSFAKLSLSALAGVTVFNTFIYIAGHYTFAINLALIGNTTAPIMAIILARIFLHERITLARAIGLVICISGVLTLLSAGNLDRLLALQFTRGDLWMLLAAFSFAVYTISVRIRPAALSPLSFLLSIFVMGTIFLVPFFIWENLNSPAIHWNAQNLGIILYLGLGTSVVSFLSWNAAIARMGAARTSLFGNLTPIFSSIEAVIFLGEKIRPFHIISFLLVIGGLVIANLKRLRPG